LEFKISGVKKMAQLDEDGFGSRKFILAIIALCLLIGVAITATWLPVLVGLFTAIVGGIVGILGVYFGANVTSQFAVGRAISSLKGTTDDTTTEDGDEEASA
jgi:uncharacterized membrane protein